MTIDEKYMRRCLQLARLGEGRTAPNPMVGCVVVHNNIVIGEGFHRYCGGWHAEVNALDSVKDKSLIKESTLYVNLEPCSHYGKTPPCSLRIIKEKVKKVVIANTDPNPQVSGRGISLLRSAGVIVETGLLEKEAWELNRRFFTFHAKHRPYIILKWAQTSDGFIDAFGEKPIRISSSTTKALVHQMRAENMAIMVGTSTAVKDNPHLNTRRWFGKNPTRITIDKSGRIPATHRIFDTSAPTFLIDREMTPAEIADYLYSNGIQSVIVEGGENTLKRFIESGLYDEVQMETGPCTCGSGTPAPEISIPSDAEILTIGGQKLIRFRHLTEP